METSQTEQKTDSQKWWTGLKEHEKVEFTRLYFPAFGYTDLDYKHIQQIYDKTEHLRSGVR